MRRAISYHLRDFLAIVALVTVAVGIVFYILQHQRLRIPLVEEAPFALKAEFSDAQGVMPGQGQTIRVSGMRVGDIGSVELEEGKAVVRMDLDREFDRLVHVDATALLRPRTGLKDMFMELDPGSDDAPLMEEGDTIPVRNTAPDIDAHEVLSALDQDTRAYLILLINGVGKGLEGRSNDLRQVFRRLAPLHRDLARLNSAVAERRENLSRLVHNYGRTITELSKKDRELSDLVTSSDKVFTALASEDENISLAVSRLPSTLRQVESALGKVRTLGETAGPAFEALRPAVREIDDANRQIRPFAEQSEPILRERIRPFVRASRPFVRNLRPTARNLAKASPDLRESFFELNRFFNLGARNPNGAEPLSGDLERDRRRDEGMLFWLAWVAQNGNGIFSTGDAAGPFRRFMLSATCTTIQGLVNEGGPAEAPIRAAITGFNAVLAATGPCGSE